ncbi:MAG: gluconate 2-dehydrogenase subunit 3 family protein [Acidipila sp.]|nr:gluconate 2-dehydrogenase subunit 3 family protein [Acidipila sp.]
MKRRHFLTLSATGLGTVLVYSLDNKTFSAVAQGQPVRIPLRFLTRTEALVVAAAASRIVPSNDSGPGAHEAGVAVYIDRQLAGPYGRDRYRYTQEPFEDGVAELGYQGKATPRQIYREGLKSLGNFLHLDAAGQDLALTRIQTSFFFAMLRQHTIEGMFCDPIHGGNKNLAGWKLIGFPGPRFSNLDDVDKHFGESFRPKVTTLREMAGHTLHPSEEER